MPVPARVKPGTYDFFNLLFMRRCPMHLRAFKLAVTQEEKGITAIDIPLLKWQGTTTTKTREKRLKKRGSLAMPWLTSDKCKCTNTHAMQSIKMPN